MNKVKDVRTRMGESQEVFAKRFGVTWRTVQNWEAGKPMTRKSSTMLDELEAMLDNDAEQPQDDGQEWYISVIQSQQRTIEMLTTQLSAKM